MKNSLLTAMLLLSSTGTLASASSLPAATETQLKVIEQKLENYLAYNLDEFEINERFSSLDKQAVFVKEKLGTDYLSGLEFVEQKDLFFGELNTNYRQHLGMMLLTYESAERASAVYQQYQSLSKVYFDNTEKLTRFYLGALDNQLLVLYSHSFLKQLTKIFLDNIVSAINLPAPVTLEQQEENIAQR